MDYTLIRAHKRTLSLQINEQGVLIARAPYLMPKFLIDRFISQKSHWIAKRRLALSKPPDPHVAHFTPDQLKEFIHKELTKYSTLMGLKYTGVRFTHVKTYWGTCAPSGVLSFNLALCYAPPDAVPMWLSTSSRTCDGKGTEYVFGRWLKNTIQRQKPRAKNLSH